MAVLPSTISVLVLEFTEGAGLQGTSAAISLCDTQRWCEQEKLLQGFLKSSTHETRAAAWHYWGAAKCTLLEIMRITLVNIVEVGRGSCDDLPQSAVPHFSGSEPLLCRKRVLPNLLRRKCITVY